MIAIAVLMIGQFAAGDTIYVRDESTIGRMSFGMARVQYVEPPQVRSLQEQRDRLFTRAQEDTIRRRKFDKLKVLEVRSGDAGKFVRAADSDNPEVIYWYNASSLSKVENAADFEKMKNEDAAKSTLLESAARLRKYVQKKSEDDAINAAIGKGLNPITMSAKEASQLTNGQRKALSEVRRRYQRGGAEK